MLGSHSAVFALLREPVHIDLPVWQIGAAIFVSILCLFWVSGLIKDKFYQQKIKAQNDLAHEQELGRNRALLDSRGDSLVILPVLHKLESRLVDYEDDPQQSYDYQNGRKIAYNLKAILQGKIMRNGREIDFHRFLDDAEKFLGASDAAHRISQEVIPENVVAATHIDPRADAAPAIGTPVSLFQSKAPVVVDSLTVVSELEMAEAAGQDPYHWHERDKGVH